MKLKIAQVIGLNTDQKAAQVTSSQREDSVFLAVLILVSDDAFTKGRQFLSELEDYYFEAEGSIAEKLTHTFKQAEEKMVSADFSLCLAAIVGKALYILSKGQVEVYLKREEKLSPLVSSGAASQLISGFIKDGDKILFSTSSLVSFLGNDLDKSLNLPVEIFEEEVEGKIGLSDLENEGLAALAIMVTEPEDAISAALPVEHKDDGREEYRKEYKPEEPELIKEPEEELAPIAQGTDEPLVDPSRKPIKKFLSLLKLSHKYFPKSGRSKLILAVILIVIIVAGVGYKYKTSQDQKMQSQFNQLIQEAKDDFSGAKGLSSLNPAEAKDKLESAVNKVKQATVLKPQDTIAQELMKQIENDKDSILQQSTVSSFPEFLDLDLIKKNYRASQMSLAGNKLLLLDPGLKTLVVIDLAKKSNQILAGSEQLGDAVFASLNGAVAFVYSKDKGLLKVDTTNSKVSTISKKDSSWGKIADVGGFTGNAYLLDSNNNQIWKYLPATDGYSSAREYLSKTIKADYSSALKMQIDSSVYVLNSNGDISKYTKGEKDSFSVQGLSQGLSNPKSFFTSSDVDKVYVLDSGNFRLVILDKTGKFESEIKGAKFATSSDLVVDEISKKIYLLEGSKIYSADLK